MNNAPQGAINMALGELRFPMPEILRAYALDVIKTGEPQYTPNAGIPELRTAIAASYCDKYSPEQICVCNGAEEAIFISLFACSNPGDKVAIPDPDYPAYQSIAKLLQLETVSLSFEPDLRSINWERWEQILCQDIRFIILSSPQNPSGYIFSAGDMVHLAQICNNKGITIIIDEIYKDLCFGEAPPQIIDYLNRVIQIGGLSKSHCLSGWRIGWIASPPEISPTMAKAKQYISTCSSWLAQKLAVFALSEEGMQTNLSIREQLAECRVYTKNKLLSVISADRLFYPSAGPYMLIDVQRNDLDFCTDLASKGLICVPGSAFGKLTKGLIRINCALPPVELQQACSILKRVLS